VNWRPVSEDAAATHRLYGMAGWLHLFYWLALGWLAWTAVQVPGALAQADGLDPVMGDVAVILVALALALRVPFPFLAVTRHPGMPLAAIGTHWLALALDGLLLALGLATRQWMLASLAALAIGPVFSLYLLRSRRVNVTYRQRVTADDPVSAPSAPA
jgi:hypothetical protein